MAKVDLAPLVEEAERVWGTLGLRRERFETELERRLADGVTTEELQVADLYLACACGAGLERAIVAFEREFAGDIAAALVRVDRRGIHQDDLRQSLREKLFVGPAPKIGEYAGRGKLRNWVRVAMLRLRIDAERRVKARPEEPAGEASAAFAALDDDPELVHLKERYREAFVAAVSASFAALEPRERNLLRQHLEHGLQTAQLATLYGVHRATLKRWLAAARERLLTATRQTMREQIGVDTVEFASVMRLLESRLDVSVRRLLASGVMPAD
jgi:RNA polymerase sigma-70 factor (ECF subfamily)